jgi:hypothetical protein
MEKGLSDCCLFTKNITHISPELNPERGKNPKSNRLRSEM